MARPPIAGGRKAVTTLLSITTMNRVEQLRSERAAQGKYVSTGEIVRELVDFALDFKDPIERLVKAQ